MGGGNGRNRVVKVQEKEDKGRRGGRRVVCWPELIDCSWPIPSDLLVKGFEKWKGGGGKARQGSAIYDYEISKPILT